MPDIEDVALVFFAFNALVLMLYLLLNRRKRKE